MGFTTIDHEIRDKFDLSLNEYAICDSVYFLSRRNPCNASKEYLGEFIGVSKQSVHKIINKLVVKKLIKMVSFGCIETSELWNDEIENGKRTVKKVYPDSKESLLSTVKKVYPDSKESLLNKDSIDTNNNNKIKKGEHPTLEMIKSYAKEKGLIVDCEFFYNYFTAGGWIDSKGNRVKSWKQKLWTWHKHPDVNSQSRVDRDVARARQIVKEVFAK